MRSINGVVRISYEEIARAQAKSQAQRNREFAEYCMNAYEETCATFYADIVKRVKELGHGKVFVC